MHNLVVIEKYSPESFFWNNLETKKRIYNLTAFEILNKYQGFEGDCICFFQLNSVDLSVEHEPIIGESIDSKNRLVLHVLSEESTMPESLKINSIKVGYDYGTCEEAATIYSSIFNEILFGHVEELVRFKNKLNENFLFPDCFTAEQFAKLHSLMSTSNKGVEDYNAMTVYEIWRQKKMGRKIR